MSTEQPKPVATNPLLSLSFRGQGLFAISFGIVCVAFRYGGTDVGIPLGTVFLVGLVAVLVFATGRRQVEWSLVGILAVLVLAAASMADLDFGAHVDSRRIHCLNNLGQIGKALMLYDKVNDGLPPAFAVDAYGVPTVSWRGIILPQMGRNDLMEALHSDEPWNSPLNRAVSQATISLYQCPSDAQGPSPMCNYVAVVGPKTAWPGAKRVKLADIKNPSKTILLIEIPDSNINWLEPRDLTVEQLKQGLGSLIPAGGASPHPDGFNALFADGHVETLPVNLDPQLLLRMLEINSPAETRN